MSKINFRKQSVTSNDMSIYDKNLQTILKREDNVLFAKTTHDGIPIVSNLCIYFPQDFIIKDLCKSNINFDRKSIERFFDIKGFGVLFEVESILYNNRWSIYIDNLLLRDYSYKIEKENLIINYIDYNSNFELKTNIIKNTFEGIASNLYDKNKL